MSAAAINLRRWSRARDLGILVADDPDPEDSNPTQDASAGSGNISVEQLQQQFAAGDFNNLQTPYPYYGYVSGQWENEYGGLNPIMPMSGGGVPPGPARTSGPSTIPYTTAGSLSSSAAASSGVLGGIESLLGAPLYSGSSITWGWALIAAFVAWLILRRA